MMETSRQPPEEIGLLSGRRVILASLCAVLVGWLLLYAHLAALRDAAFERARTTTGVMSRVLAAHAEQAFLAVDLMLQSFDDRRDLPGINLLRRPEELQSVLRQLRDTSLLLEGLGVVNAAGRVVASGEPTGPPGIDLSDRDYFIVHRDNPDAGMVISRPVIGRPTNRWTIPVTRRLEDGSGRFAGVVAARLRLQQFEALYAPQEVDFAMLVRDDGTILFRSNGNDAVQNQGIQLSAEARQLLARTSHGTDDMVDIDGGLRLVTHTAVRGYPLTTLVGVASDTVLARWRETRDQSVAVGLASTLFLLLFTWLFWRRVQNQEALAAAVLTARQQAEQASQAKSTFLAHMSHELRSPLNAVIGFSEIIKQEMFGPVGSPRYGLYAGYIRSSGEHLLAIINNILDLAKVEAGKWEVSLARVALPGVAADLANLTETSAREHGVELVIVLDETLPIVVSDRRLLLQILLNLTSNGIKFTPAGGTVRVVGRLSAPDQVGIDVIDSGDGMKPEEIARIREPFRKGSGELARRNHGTGLGLPLAFGFAELIGGSIEIDSRAGSGTRMTLLLPLAGPAA